MKISWLLKKIGVRIRVLPATFLVSDFNTNPLFSGISQQASVPGLINALFKIAIIVGGMLAVLRLVYAGFLYMTSDIFSKKEDAKEAITNAIIGLLLLVSTVIVLGQIDPHILNLDITQGLTPVVSPHDSVR